MRTALKTATKMMAETEAGKEFVPREVTREGASPLTSTATDEEIDAIVAERGE
jgi:hypothetical protein